MEKFWRRLGRPLLRYGVKIVALLLAVSIVAFLLVCLSPVDPVQQYILGLGSAISPEQRAEIEAYWASTSRRWSATSTGWGSLLQGNWGESALYRRPVLDIIGERFVNSLALMLCAWVLSGVIGFVLGCLMGMYQGKWPDRLLKKIAYLISSNPHLLAGSGAAAGLFRLAPLVPHGTLRPHRRHPGAGHPGPAAAPSGIAGPDAELVSFANIALHTRQKLIDVLNSEYVLFAGPGGRDAGRCCGVTACGTCFCRR